MSRHQWAFISARYRTRFSTKSLWLSAHLAIIKLGGPSCKPKVGALHYGLSMEYRQHRKMLATEAEPNKVNRFCHGCTSLRSRIKHITYVVDFAWDSLCFTTVFDILVVQVTHIMGSIELIH